MENNKCYVCLRPFELETSFQCPKQDAVMCRKYLQDRINLQIDFIFSLEVTNVSICFKCHPRLEKLLKLHFKLEELQKQIDEVLDVFCDELLNTSSHISTFDIESVIKEAKENPDTLQTYPAVENSEERPLFNCEFAEITRKSSEDDHLGNSAESPEWKFDYFESTESTGEVCETDPLEISYNHRDGSPNSKIIPATKELRIILERLPLGEVPSFKKKPTTALKSKRLGKSLKCKQTHPTPFLINGSSRPKRNLALNSLRCIAMQIVHLNEGDVLENTHESNEQKMQDSSQIIQENPPISGINMDENCESPDYAENGCKLSVECPQCDRKFLSYQCLEEHTKSSHGGLVICAECGKKFPTNCSYRKHFWSRHSESSKKFKCDKCGAGFRNTRCLSSHTEKECQTKYKCIPCEKEFNTRVLWLAHVRFVHSGGEAGFSCPFCKMKFLRHKHLNGHMAVHSNVRPFSCKLCEKSFKTKQRLNRHVLIHDPATRPKNVPRLKKFQCTICEQKFTTKGNLEEHIRTHTGERPFMCDKCAFTTTTLGLLRSHEKCTHTDNKYGDEFKCRLCGKRSKNENSLKVHMRWMHEKSIPCSECGEKFTNKSSLNLHMTSHNLALPFSCSICGARFSMKRDLGYHEQIHCESKIKCPRSGCEKYFPTERKLRIHLRSHNTNAVSCENCNKLFKNNGSIRKHIRLNRCKPAMPLPQAESWALNLDIIGNYGGF